MAIVYGYFGNDEDARKASQHFQELGIPADVITQPDRPNYVRETQQSQQRWKIHRRVWKISLFAAAFAATFGAIVATVLPAMWGNTVIAGPLLMALYGIAVGLSVASIFDLRSTDDAVPEEIVGHAPAQRVLIVHTNDYPLMKVEQLLESDGAIEVIHRAA